VDDRSPLTQPPRLVPEIGGRRGRSIKVPRYEYRQSQDISGGMRPGLKLFQFFDDRARPVLLRISGVTPRIRIEMALQSLHGVCDGVRSLAVLQIRRN